MNQELRMPVLSSPCSERWLEDPDVCLMLRVRDGETELFTDLVDRYSARVFGYFFRQIGDRGEAEDLTQEVFLRLYRSRARYEPRARFATWVYHVTQNVARNALRSRRRRPCVPLDAAALQKASLVGCLLTNRGEDPSHLVERRELANVVRSAVAELANRQRAAVELHQFGNRTYAEVAEELDITPKAAKSLLYRARNHLRTALTPFMS